MSSESEARWLLWLTFGLAMSIGVAVVVLILSVAAWVLGGVA